MDHDFSTQQKKSFGKKRPDSQSEFSHDRQAAAAYYQPNVLQESFNSGQTLNYPEPVNDDTTIQFTVEQLNQITSILDSSNLELDPIIARSNDNDDTTIQFTVEQLNQITSILDSSNLELDPIIARSNDREHQTKVQALTQHLTAELANFQTKKNKKLIRVILVKKAFLRNLI